MKLNVESADWFVKPEMMGHIWAKQTVETVKALVAKYAKTNPQKHLAKYCLPLESTDWHAWSQVTKKSLNILRYVLRRLHQQDPVTLLYYVNATQGCLKDELTWYLEDASYNSDYREDYYKSYRYPFIGLGMSEEDCRERFKTYHEERLAKHELPKQ
jgi:hypothetical protein